MAHWLILLIELLLIRSFRVSCPQDDNFFWGAVDVLKVMKVFVFIMRQ